jgi:hypothetical protein
VTAAALLLLLLLLPPFFAFALSAEGKKECQIHEKERKRSHSFLNNYDICREG